MESNKSLTERLSQWSACDIADGLSALGYKHGGFLEGLCLRSPQPGTEPSKIVGPAMTVKFAAKEETSAPKVKGNYIDQVPPDAVLFISQPAPHINACYGGLMSLRAKYLNAAGVVIDGSVRDVEEHQSIGFPVFSRGIGTTAGGAVCFPSELNVPVALQSSVQSAQVNPGDYIIADVNGVVCLPGALAEKVLEIVPKRVAADQKCAEAIGGGMSVEEAFAKYRGK